MIPSRTPDTGRGVEPKLARKVTAALNKRHMSNKQKLRNVAKRAGK